MKDTPFFVAPIRDRALLNRRFSSVRPAKHFLRHGLAVQILRRAGVRDTGSAASRWGTPPLVDMS
jgi:hypothetical protein